MFSKALQSTVVIGLVSNKAANGDYTANPFNFHHFNMTKVNMKVNGVEYYGSPFSLDFGVNRNYAAAYGRIFEFIDKWLKGMGLDISLVDFKGYTCIVFSLDPCDFQEDYLNLVKHGRQKLANRFWNREPFIVVSKPDTNIPVYVIKPEYGKGKTKTKTVHRNLLLPIYSLPTEELVPHNKKERNSKCTSETNRVDDEIQIVESVKDTEDTGSVHDSSDESDSDSDYALMPFDQPGRYKAITSSSLNPSAEEFSPLSSIVSGSQGNQTQSSDMLNLSNGTGNASSTSETHSGLSSRHIDETLNTSSRLTQEQSSLTTQNSDISNEVRSVPERTHVSVEQFNEPVLRCTSRQS
ncbi:unnamed protein product [Mytilus edulis]|uniref:Uncharacterized protein n=1 Tax=Mytilus edulis TaxID=6550 RepID=A0A8S3RQ93_MYTED|nr:unnamed protein product [Mytilus edulis]